MAAAAAAFFLSFLLALAGALAGAGAATAVAVAVAVEALVESSSTPKRFVATSCDRGGRGRTRREGESSTSRAPPCK